MYLYYIYFYLFLDTCQLPTPLLVSFHRVYAKALPSIAKVKLERSKTSRSSSERGRHSLAENGTGIEIKCYEILKALTRSIWMPFPFFVPLGFTEQNGAAGENKEFCLVKRKRRKLSNGHKRVVPLDLLSIPFILISLQHTFVIVRRKGAFYSIQHVYPVLPTGCIIIAICACKAPAINIHKADPSKRLLFTLAILYFSVTVRTISYGRSMSQGKWKRKRMRKVKPTDTCWSRYKISKRSWMRYT